MAYRMVFSDMDGTLLKSASELSEKNIEMVGKAVDQGVEFVICTGRGVYGVERFLEKLHLLGRPGYVICQNGAAVYNLENMEMVLKHSFSSDDLRPVVEIAREEGVEVYLYDDRTFVAEKVTPQVEAYCRVMHADMRILPDGLEYEGYFTKCLLSGSYEQLDAEKSGASHCGKTEPFLLRPAVSGICENRCQQGQSFAGNSRKSRCASGGSHCHWGQ